MSDKIPNLNKKFQEIYNLGLWPKLISPPEPQVLERLHNLDVDLYKRKYGLSVPDEGGAEILQRVRENHHAESKKKKNKKIVKKDKKKWEKTRRENFIHLGKGVSARLSDKQMDTKLLKLHSLPKIADAKQLSKFLSLEIPVIKSLSYHRITHTYSNYVEFSIPKKSGGMRYISSPKPYLKSLQYKIKEDILDRVKLPEHVFGFKKGISNYDNATCHLKAEIIINIDIKDFFPSINFYRVRGLFTYLGYSGEIATVLSLLTTKQDSKRVEIGEQTYHSFSNHRYLPQGSPTSPAISNLVSLPMDYQLIRRVEPLNFKYSRYADDMTFSSVKNPAKIKAILSIARQTLDYYGLMANPNKVKVLGKGNRQEITGLVLNSGTVTIPRKWRRILRARIHHFLTKKAGDPVSILSSIEYLSKTHPKLAKSLKKKVLNAL